MRIVLLLILSLIFFASEANAKSQKDFLSPQEEFSYAEALDDATLDTFRGGWNFGPIGIDLQLITQIAMLNAEGNLNAIQTYLFDSTNGNITNPQILRLLENGGRVQDLPSLIVIQNNLPGTDIGLTQVMDVTITGSMMYMTQLALGNSLQDISIDALH
jgi:hypothetical protein